MRAYCIIDVKHSLALAVSPIFDGTIHHHEPTSDRSGLWIVEPAGESRSFYLRDALHGKYIVAPDEYTGMLIHADDVSHGSAQWSFFPMYEGPGGELAVTIKDRKHGFALVAGDAPDGRIYHQEPNGRMNAFWTLVPVAELEPVHGR